MSRISKANSGRGSAAAAAPRLPEDFPATLEELHESPLYKHLGIRVTEVTKERASVRLVAAEHHKNLQGVYHGGSIAAAIDSAAALAAMATVGPAHTVSSIDLKMNFIAPVVGGHVDAAATVVHRGRRTVVCDIEARQGSTLVAKALATYAVLEAAALRRIEKHARP